MTIRVRRRILRMALAVEETLFAGYRRKLPTVDGKQIGESNPGSSRIFRAMVVESHTDRFNGYQRTTVWACRGLS